MSDTKKVLSVGSCFFKSSSFPSIFKKSGLREVKEHAQYHTASERQLEIEYRSHSS